MITEIDNGQHIFKYTVAKAIIIDIALRMILIQNRIWLLIVNTRLVKSDWCALVQTEFSWALLQNHGVQVGIASKSGMFQRKHPLKTDQYLET